VAGVVGGSIPLPFAVSIAQMLCERQFPEMSLPQLSSASGLRMAGDESCLEAYQRELDYVYRIFSRLGIRHPELDDLVQDLFVVLHRSWLSVDQRRPLRPYLAGIAVKIAMAHRRKRSREVFISKLDIVDAGPGPESTIDSKQTRALLLAALARVPLSRRAVIVMHELGDIPVADVAAALSIPLFTAYSRLRKGRQELEAQIKRLLKGAPHRP
jgi:RNA polymerase sigma-70 factor (ECF subfamily)